MQLKNRRNRGRVVVGSCPYRPMAINMCRCQCHGWFSRCFMYRFLVSGYSSGSMTSHQPSNNGPSHNLQIQYLQSVSHYWFSKLFFFFHPRYRTLSIHLEEKSSKATPGDTDAVRQIDVHTIPIDLVYKRFSTSPTLGL